MQIAQQEAMAESFRLHANTPMLPYVRSSGMPSAQTRIRFCSDRVAPQEAPGIV